MVESKARNGYLWWNTLMKIGCYLFREEHEPRKAAFPAIDAHNHLWGNWELDKLIKTMDSVGIVSYCDLTANTKLSFVEGGYHLEEGRFEDFVKHCGRRYPGRFYGFSMATFARPTKDPLFKEASEFIKETVSLLQEHVELGARGLKITKELGLHYKDAQGKLVSLDDPRLSAIWEAAGELGVPVLMHQSDPYGFFEPATAENEHYESLKKYPTWCFADAKFPRKKELLDRRDNLVRRHRRTTFILAHVANFAENLDYVSRLLDENLNVYIDFSARIDELGRQPYSAREFFLRYQDRILFGTDMPASVQMYRCYFRFLETFDEYFFAPDYDGTFERHRWGICGIGLPAEVLAKIYYQNALKIIPGLKKDMKDILPDVND